MTSKEWVIPPRPKPGRKPATDTPPTKRKAQNRAAQRAFRERRAARVGELEEQIEEEKAVHERTVQELQDRVNHLEAERQTLQSRCQWLESMLEKERQARSDLAANWDARRQASARNDVLLPSLSQQVPDRTSQAMPSLQPAQVATHSISVAEARPLPQPFSISQIVSPPAETRGAVDLGCGGCQADGPCACAEAVLQDADIAMGCGKCSLDTSCECLEETLRASMAAPVPDLKRPLPRSSSPTTSPEEKRQRSDAGMAMETDFTAMFSSRAPTQPAQSILPPPPPQQHLQPIASIEPRDSCGFCKEGTYCVCADAMISSSALPAPPIQPSTEQSQMHTPPPSDTDVIPTPMEVTATGAIKLPGLKSLQQQQQSRITTRPPARAGGCGPNGPGTCAQCLADPKSGLFCRSLAANFERNNPGSSTSGGGCCGNGGPGGCCKAGPDATPTTTTTATTNTPPALPAPTTTTTTTTQSSSSSGFGLSLSCADAYKTLASHRHFDRAADDIGSWLPKLKALPVPRPSLQRVARGGGRGRDGRAPIEVEAASIMSVLKDFDVRFGRGE